MPWAGSFWGVPQRPGVHQPGTIIEGKRDTMRTCNCGGSMHDLPDRDALQCMKCGKTTSGETIATMDQATKPERPKLMASAPFLMCTSCGHRPPDNEKLHKGYNARLYHDKDGRRCGPIEERCETVQVAS